MKIAAEPVTGFKLRARGAKCCRRQQGKIESFTARGQQRDTIEADLGLSAAAAPQAGFGIRTEATAAAQCHAGKRLQLQTQVHRGFLEHQCLGRCVLLDQHGELGGLFGVRLQR